MSKNLFAAYEQKFVCCLRAKICLLLMNKNLFSAYEQKSGARKVINYMIFNTFLIIIIIIIIIIISSDQKMLLTSIVLFNVITSPNFKY